MENNNTWNNTEKLKEVQLIKQTCELILNYKSLALSNNISKDDFFHTVNNKFPEFAEHYPSLLKMLCESNNLKNLDNMLDSIINICNNKDTLDNVKNKISENLAEEYVYPKVGKPYIKKG